MSDVSFPEMLAMRLGRATRRDSEEEASLLPLTFPLSRAVPTSQTKL